MLTIFQEKRAPVVFLVGGENFLTKRLQAFLEVGGAKVLFVEDKPPQPIPDYIFHLSCFTRPPTQESQVFAFEVLAQLRDLLKIAQTHKARFLLACPYLFGDTEEVVGKDWLEEFYERDSHLHFARSAERLVVAFGKKVDARIVRLGDVYGPGMPLVPGSPFSEMLRQRLYREEVKESPGFVFPLFGDDAARGFLSAMFGADTRGKIFYFDLPKISVSTLARIIKGEDSVSPALLPLPQKVKFVLPSPTPIKEGLDKTISFFEKYKLSRPPTTPWGSEPRKSLPKRRLGVGAGKLFWVMFLLVFILSLPFVSLFFGGSLIEAARRQIVVGQFHSAQGILVATNPLFSFSQKTFDLLSHLPLIGSQTSTLLDISFTGISASKTLHQATAVGILGGKIIENIFSQEGEITEKTLDDFAREVSLLANYFGLLETQKRFFGESPSLFSLSTLSRQLPNILGFEGKRVYLVLFQNNMELRPTGGFIGSLGLFTFERGKLTDAQIFDVYEADGQLGGHVEPPQKLKEHLGEANWYLRDSNWSPDFPTTAQRARWFLDKELGKSVDGVVAIDLEFVKSIIKILGEVKVSDFNEAVNSSNFYRKTQARAEVGFFPGSRGKADFLTALFRSLVREVSAEMTPDFVVPLGRAILSSLEEKHMLLLLDNKEAKSAIAQLGWDGGLKNSKCKIQNAKCVEDYLFLVEANVGVNKANYNITRTHLLDIKPLEDRISHELVISYKNQARESTDYKNYLRVYVNAGTSLLKSTVVHPKTGEREIISFDEGEEGGKRVFGFLVQVPKAAERQVYLSWESPGTGLKSGGELSFLWQKQPGTIKDPVVLRFHKTEGFILEVFPKPSLTQDGFLGYNTTLARDFEAKVLWKK